MNFKPLLVFCFVLLAVLSVNADTEEKGYNWERVCSNITATCTQTFYSNQKYYNVRGEWEEIKENWTETGCDKGYNYCVIDNTQNYQVHVKTGLNSPISIKIITPDRQDVIYYQPDRLEDDAGTFVRIRPNVRAVIEGNELIYRDIFNTGDLILRYLPARLKEEVILYREPFSVVGNLSFITKTTTSFSDIRGNETIRYYRNNVLKAEIDKPEELGNNRNSRLGFGLNQNKIKITVDYQPHNFRRDGALIIDPSTTLDFNNIMIDADASRKRDVGLPDVFGSLASGTTLRNGLIGCDTANTTYRSAFDWDVSSIPDLSTVLEVKAQYTIGSVEPNSKFLAMTNLTFHLKDVGLLNLEKFNQLYGNDYGSISSVLASSQRNITLTQSARTRLQNAINGDDIFSYGLNNLEQDALPSCPTTDSVLTRVVSKEHATASFRPVLYVTYGRPPFYYNLSVDPLSPQNFILNNSANFTICVGDLDADRDTVLLSIDGFNFTADPIGNQAQECYFNVTVGNDTFNHSGTYNYYWWMNDSLGLSNQTETFQYELRSSWEYSIIYALIFSIIFLSKNLNKRRRIYKTNETQKK